MNIRTGKPYVALVEPADTCQQVAENRLEFLMSWPEVVVLMIDQEANYKHLLQLQHYFSRGYYLSDTSVIELDSGSYQGVYLYRPSDMGVKP